MDSLLLDFNLPRDQVLEGAFDPALMGGAQGGWRGRLTLFETAPNPLGQLNCTERLEMEVWWMSGGARRTFSLESYRRNMLTPAELPQLGLAPR
jgi:hypothetical protein